MGRAALHPGCSAENSLGQARSLFWARSSPALGAPSLLCTEWLFQCGPKISFRALGSLDSSPGPQLPWGERRSMDGPLGECAEVTTAVGVAVKSMSSGTRPPLGSVTGGPLTLCVILSK